jgi:hypothetical protein
MFWFGFCIEDIMKESSIIMNRLVNQNYIYIKKSDFFIIYISFYQFIWIVKIKLLVFHLCILYIDCYTFELTSYALNDYVYVILFNIRLNYFRN